MSGTAVGLLVAGLALVAGLSGVIAWLLAASRVRIGFDERARALEDRLRAAEGEARAERAAGDERRSALAAAEDRAERLGAALTEAERARAIAETQVDELRRSLADERELLASAEARLGDTFRALAADALRANNAGFLALASEKLGAARREHDADLVARQTAIENVIAPVRESLSKVDGQIQQMERERGQAYGRLLESVRALSGTQERLQAETGALARALRAPTVRGRWGEVQLKRVVELAGMVEHCDFSQQVTLVCEDGRLRPDLVVRLPGARHVVVDAKVPFDAYMAAAEAETEDLRRARLREHAGQVRAHLSKLGSKAYWAELSGTPEFVVMFLPHDGIFAAALEEAPGLFEEGIARRVLVATPTTLIALLQTVHLGWREEKVAENAQRISEEGRLLHERVATLVEHWARLGSSLQKASEHFNAATLSYEGRVLPSLRRLEELGAGGKKEVGALPRIEVRPRLVALESAGERVTAG